MRPQNLNAFVFLHFDAFRLSGRGGSGLPSAGASWDPGWQQGKAGQAPQVPEQGERSGTRDGYRSWVLSGDHQASLQWPGRSHLGETWGQARAAWHRPGLAESWSRTATPGQPPRRLLTGLSLDWAVPSDLSLGQSRPIAELTWDR